MKSVPLPHPPDSDLVDITAETCLLPDFSAHRSVWEIRDEGVGLHGFIAIHDTTLGPALGGCRMVAYGSREQAITDALRLSRGMTLKAALAGLDFGGGKAVLIGDPGRDKSEGLFLSLGRAVESLGGEYTTGEDVGIGVREMDWVERETLHVIGTTACGGDPAEMTALGVFVAIRAALRQRLGRDRISGMTVAVQGLGHVGYELCKQLKQAGADLVVADVAPAAVERAVAEFGARAVAPEDIYRAEADVFAPCALGAILDDHTVPQLRCAVVAGSANNQLRRDEHGEALMRRGILFAPDYVANAGGLISAAAALGRHGEDTRGEAVQSKIRSIDETLTEIFAESHARRIPPGAVTDEIAARRIRNRRQETHRVA